MWYYRMLLSTRCHLLITIAYNSISPWTFHQYRLPIQYNLILIFVYYMNFLLQCAFFILKDKRKNVLKHLFIHLMNILQRKYMLQQTVNKTNSLKQPISLLLFNFPGMTWRRDLRHSRLQIPHLDLSVYCTTFSCLLVIKCYYRIVHCYLYFENIERGFIFWLNSLWNRKELLQIFPTKIQTLGFKEVQMINCVIN